MTLCQLLWPPRRTARGVATEATGGLIGEGGSFVRGTHPRGETSVTPSNSTQKSPKAPLKTNQPFSFEAPSLLRTASIAVGGSTAELHILSGASQFWSCLLALKSVLRFIHQVSVAIHSDGTLTRQHERVFREHFPGVRLISKEVADEAVGLALEDFPNCREFRSQNVVLAQVFDYSLLSMTNKIIAMDSDILFLGRPGEVIDWIKRDQHRSLYSFEPLPFSPLIDRIYITQLHSHGFKFAPHLCGGFICTYRELLNLPLLEQYCEYVKAKCTDRFYRAQTMSALLVAQEDWALLPSSYQNFSEFADDPVPLMRHYWLSNMDRRNWKTYTTDAWRILGELNTSRVAATLKKIKILIGAPYDLYGRWEDGWMAPYGAIEVLRVTNTILTLTVEIPGWLPFIFPVCIKAVQNDRQIAILRAEAPGTYTLNVPLTRLGVVEFLADQWFIPARLGMSSDKREICYRILRQSETE